MQGEQQLTTDSQSLYNPIVEESITKGHPIKGLTRPTILTHKPM
jgi:hypothetical protein